ANAYGHGLLRSCAALSGADGFAVLELDAAVRLREAGYSHPILLLEGWFDAQELMAFGEHGLIGAVHNLEQVEMLEQATLRAPIPVFLKLNTGMNRLGFAPNQLGAALMRLRSCANVASIVLMTHFATADDERDTAWQSDLFDRVTGMLGVPASMANSAALLRHPELARDWVRPGIVLYGSSPLADRSAAQLDLRPVMTLQSKIIAVQDLEPGGVVGYGATFLADRRTRLGVVACGYADGYPRHAPTGTPIAVMGHRTRLIGRVSMDMICVDLTDLPAAGIGSEVVLWGEGLPIEDVAAAAGTVSYELMCALAARVPVVEV
ncbi:MAG: alanine racemase, partial [Proteobacteria bacterium]